MGIRKYKYAIAALIFACVALCGLLFIPDIYASAEADGFRSERCYVNDFEYGDFKGDWLAPIAVQGNVYAKVYSVTGEGRTLEKEGLPEDLYDEMSLLPAGKYELDWTTDDGDGLLTNAFTVNKAENSWADPPHMENWTWGSYDERYIRPSAQPSVVIMDFIWIGPGFEEVIEEPVYFKITDSGYKEIQAFYDYAENFYKDENGDYWYIFIQGDKIVKERLILTHDGYFDNIGSVAEVVRQLKPDTYHLLAYYDGDGDYEKLEGDCTFSVLRSPNRWLQAPTVAGWSYGETPDIPTAQPLYGEEVKYTYYKAQLDDKGKPVFKNGKYSVVEGSEFGGWGENETAEAGVYVIRASVEGTEYYEGLEYDLVLRVSQPVSNYWVKTPTIQSWTKGGKRCKPDGEAAHGGIKWSYYRAVYDEASGAYKRDGEGISTQPEEVGKYLLVATTEEMPPFNQLTCEVLFEIYEPTPAQTDGNAVFVYLTVAFAAAALGLGAALTVILIKKFKHK